MIEILIDVSEKAVPYVTAAVTLASILIKFLPELPEESKWKPLIRFIGKYVALNRPRDGKVSITINN